jgi:hypothetical protein
MEDKKLKKEFFMIQPVETDGLTQIVWTCNRSNDVFKTDFSTKAELLALANGGSLPAKSDVNEIYEDATLHGVDLVRYGTGSEEHFKCIDRFIRSFC